MAYTIIAEDQLRRINSLINNMEAIESLPLEQLNYKPAPKKWSTLEVIDHLNVAYTLYLERIDAVLPSLREITSPQSNWQVGWFNRMVINSIKPKGEQIGFKMGTMPRFEPINARSQNPKLSDPKTIFQDFYFKYNHLSEAIKTCRYKDCSTTKINSAIGPIVRFYLPEAFEFLLVHAERHWLQIQNNLSHNNKAVA